jgi:hypothetical protein
VPAGPESVAAFVGVAPLEVGLPPESPVTADAAPPVEPVRPFAFAVPLTPLWPATERVAAVAPIDAAKLLTINVVCAAVVAERLQPPATPEATIAPSTVGMILYKIIGVTAAIRKHTNPDINVPTAAAASLINA